MGLCRLGAHQIRRLPGRIQHLKQDPGGLLEQRDPGLYIGGMIGGFQERCRR